MRVCALPHFLGMAFCHGQTSTACICFSGSEGFARCCHPPSTVFGNPAPFLPPATKFKPVEPLGRFGRLFELYYVFMKVCFFTLTICRFLLTPSSRGISFRRPSEPSENPVQAPSRTLRTVVLK
jgi:hypothetical protein